MLIMTSGHVNTIRVCLDSVNNGAFQAPIRVGLLWVFDAVVLVMAAVQHLERAQVERSAGRLVEVVLHVLEGESRAAPELAAHVARW